MILSPVHRHIGPQSGASILCTRPDEAVVSVLLENVGCPPGYTAARENGRVKVGRDAHAMVARGRIEVDVRVDAFFGNHYIFKSPRYVEPFGLTASFTQVVGELLQDHCTRIIGLINTVTEAHDLFFLIQSLTKPRFGVL